MPKNGIVDISLVEDDGQFSGKITRSSSKPKPKKQTKSNSNKSKETKPITNTQPMKPTQPVRPTPVKTAAKVVVQQQQHDSTKSERKIMQLESQVQALQVDNSKVIDKLNKMNNARQNDIKEYAAGNMISPNHFMLATAITTPTSKDLRLPTDNVAQTSATYQKGTLAQSLNRDDNGEALVVLTGDPIYPLLTTFAEGKVVPLVSDTNIAQMSIAHAQNSKQVFQCIMYERGIVDWPQVDPDVNYTLLGKTFTKAHHVVIDAYNSTSSAVSPFEIEMITTAKDISIDIFDGSVNIGQVTNTTKFTANNIAAGTNSQFGKLSFIRVDGTDEVIPDGSYLQFNLPNDPSNLSKLYINNKDTTHGCQPSFVGQWAGCLMGIPYPSAEQYAAPGVEGTRVDSFGCWIKNTQAILFKGGEFSAALYANQIPDVTVSNFTEMITSKKQAQESVPGETGCYFYYVPKYLEPFQDFETRYDPITSPHNIVVCVFTMVSVEGGAQMNSPVPLQVMIDSNVEIIQPSGFISEEIARQAPFFKEILFSITKRWTLYKNCDHKAESHNDGVKAAVDASSEVHNWEMKDVNKIAQGVKSFDWKSLVGVAETGAEVLGAILAL